jgi:hypothetical protein
MKNVPLKLTGRVLLVCLLAGLGVIRGSAKDSAPSSQAATTSGPASSKAPGAKTAGGVPSAADIAAAKASGKVWVNLSTGIYHRGGRWYGKTKDGKFMTADEAKKAGYKPAKRD